MPEIAYYWFGSLSIDAALSAHKQRTGQPAQQIVCRTVDLPEVAKQLRPETVELQTNNYVQRGTLYLAALQSWYIVP